MDSKSDDSGMPHRYSADRPLESLADDQLDRADFAERLAADVMGWHGKDSLVVSVNGEWGSGKTTLKNFICEKLEAKGKPVIVEFNPWAWSGQDKLPEGFFSSLHSKFRESPDMEAMAERWEKLEHWMKFGAEASETVSKALTPLFGGSVIVALLSNNASDLRLQLGGVALGIAGVVITSFLTAFPGIVAHLAAFYRRKTSPSLAKLRREITKDLNRLREEKRPVIVIIDDIDRLNADEIRFLFQLVKVNADFPNLVYVLLFQANIVTKALGEVSADSGEEYLKKIVQVPMDLPHASRSRMQAILVKGLNQIIDDERVKIRWDKKRYLELFEDYLWPYFNTLRDVKRFLGTFDFHYHGQIENGVLQVNPVDLLAIEILRTFDHDAYLAVRDSLGFNLPKKFMRLFIGDSERRKEITVEIDAIAAQVADKAHQDRLRHILNALFPDTFDEEERSHAERDLRICHPDHFPRYFEHSPDRKPTSASNLHSLFGALSDRTKFAQRLRELSAEKQIEAILGKIFLYFEEIPSNAGEGFVGGLFDAGDEFPEACLGMFNQSPDLMAGRMVVVFLRKDRTWLAKVTNSVSQHWRQRNQRKAVHVELTPNGNMPI
jgi:predicted KAP-like P-loop ATPase